MEKPFYVGHRKRIKEKYKKNGLTGWADYEVLELLLSFAIPRKDTKSLAKTLIKYFKSLSGVLDAETADLESIKGLSKHSAVLIKLIKDISIFYMRQSMADLDIISNPILAVRYLKVLLKGSGDEEFHALFLDSSNHLLLSKKVHDGTVNKSVVYPRKVVEYALLNKAAGVIIAHNHPSGSLKPSEDDLKTTSAVKNALETVDISLLDHVLITKNGYLSFKEKGML
ncbi:MAG: DNA repair protein RadC [Elusimicrobia bacterium]|nr:DNA repair protein RadC [Elusimicrobiota bacterium]